MEIHVATFDAGSELAAFEYATDLAAVTGGELTAVHVVAPPGPTDPTRGGAVPEGTVSRVATESDLAAVRAGERTLERAAAQGTELGYDVRTELLYGDPSASLVRFVEDAGASILVVERPTDEQGGDRSATEELVERAPVPVIVVPA